MIFLNSQTIAEDDSLKALYDKLQIKLKNIEKDKAKWQADRERYKIAFENYKQDEQKSKKRYNALKPARIL